MSGPLQGVAGGAGDPIRIIAGKEVCDVDFMNDAAIAEAIKLTDKMNPRIKAAREAREVVTELLKGIGYEMTQFEESCRDHLNVIRGKRIAMVSEATSITAALKEVRQFFIGSDYKTEMERLGEFVSLCERLQKLKDSGFLDQVADTMLNLADGKAGAR
jgi:hypothetical protein